MILCRIHVIAVILFLSSYNLDVMAQVNYPDFRVFSIRDGIVDNSVRSIVQDKEGYLWLLSKKTISKFDGQRFHDMTPKVVDPLTVGFDRLFTDSSGELYIALSKGFGLLKYDHRLAEYHHVLKRSQQQIGNDAVHINVLSS
ncbi:MAG: hypothetical protein KI790_16370, partial [Cyclobacteriaceae bacterium]|nr:hypothetical protein [Cyclobacteriaceae bacterium HetDA_MAG_MS6]